jgi:hypothetical protein
MDQNELKRTLAKLGITDTEHNIRIDPGSGKIQRETYLNWEDTGYRIEPGTGKVQKDAWTHWEETGYRVDSGSGRIQKDAWTHWEETGRRVDPESGRIQKDAWTHWDDSGHRIEPDTGRLQRERWHGWEDAGTPRGIDPQSEVDNYAGHSSGTYSSISSDYSAADYSSSGSSGSSSKSRPGVFAGVIFLIIALVGVAYFFSRRSSGSQITDGSSSLPGVAYLNTEQLNVRNGPGSEYSAISKLPFGTRVSTLQRAQSADGGTWVKIRHDLVEGWVNEKLLSSSQTLSGTALSENSSGDIEQWEAFWTKFSTAVNNNDKASIKRMMSNPFDSGGGGDYSPDDWIKFIDDQAGWQTMRESVASGTKPFPEYSQEVKMPSRVTGNRYLIFALHSDGHWRWVAVMGD